MKYNMFLFFKMFLVFILYFLALVIFSELHMDNVWNYGFAYNISRGLVPYRDFNMIITPFYAFLSSIFISLFGNYLFILDIFNSVCISLIFFFGYKKIGNKIFVLLPLILFSYASYNVFCLFLFFLIIYIYDFDFNHKDFILGLLVALLFLTKQTVGIFVFVPILIYSENKFKCFLGFLIPNILFVLYLVYNHCIYQFFDYCFLGMLDFSKGNGSIYNFNFLFELLIICYCCVKLFKSKFRDRYLFFVLMFQIMSFPIFDFPHFILSFFVFMFYFFYKNDLNKKILLLFLVVFICLFFSVYLREYSFSWVDNKVSFLYGKNVSSSYFYDSLEEIVDYIEDIDIKKSRLFVISQFAYLVKLEAVMCPDKYDLINKGNMGYNGNIKYIKEIDDYCDSNKCLFLVSFDSEKTQTDQKIIKYIKKNYEKIDKIELFTVYSN